MKRIFTSIAILLLILAGIGTAVFLGLNKWLILSFISFSGVFCIAATWFINKAFLDGVKKSAEFAATVSQGDLSGRVYLQSDDEVGMLSESLNRMAINLSLMLAEVKSSVLEISGLIERNYETSELVTRGTLGQTRSLNEMFLSIKSLGDAIRSASESVDAVLGLTLKASENADEGKNALRLLLSEAEAIKTSSEQVYSIITIMNDISEKTRLLALNASLRSEGGGTGFGPEIRKLAERIADSSKGIEKTVSINLEISRRAVTAIEEVNRAFNRIRNDVEDITRLARAVQTSASDEQSESERLTTLKDSVSDDAEKNIRHINQLIEHTDALSRKTAGLKDLTARFRTDEER
jgi:methyl-accepting chemotaxis protein